MVPAAILAIAVFLAVFGPYVVPHDPGAINPRDGGMPPVFIEGGTWEYPLGTDRLGRDVLSRLIVATRVSLLIATAVIGLGGIVGVTLGIVAGYHGGWVGIIIMRLVDLSLGFPALLVGLVIAASVGSGFWLVATVIAFVAWPRFARQVHSETLAIRERDFVALAKVAGASEIYIMWHHVLPSIFNTLVVLATLLSGWAIIMEATLSFLGIGIPPPAPTWGNMIADGRTYVASLWWIALFPGIAISVVSLAFNLFGDWLRDTLDPHLRNI